MKVKQKKMGNEYWHTLLLEVEGSFCVCSALMTLMMLILMIEHRGITRQTWHVKECIRVQEELLHCQVRFLPESS